MAEARGGRCAGARPAVAHENGLDPADVAPAVNARFILGLLLLVVGAGGALDLAGVWDFSSFAGTWWPAVLIALGLVQLVTHSGRWFGPTVVVAIGVYLLLRNLDLVGPGLGRYAWAVAAIALGLVLVLGSLRRGGRSRRAEPAQRVEENRLHRFAAFGGFEERVGSRSFEGGDVTVLFGGADLDLREAVLARDARLNATAIFGGVTVLVPEGTNVALHGTPVFGGFENKTRGSPDGPALRVDGLALFGSVEVRDRPKD